jgi:hypothetical protein
MNRNAWEFDTTPSIDGAELRPSGDTEQMTITARAFVIGVELGRGRSLTTAEVAELIGLTHHGAGQLMNRASLNRRAPLYQDDDWRWKLADNEE